MSVSASLVMKLRERTGAGMMDCKKFLVECNGDIDAAVLAMQKAGQTKADKKADRVAAEGNVVILRTEDGKRAVMLEINSETDFVARDANFIEFAQKVAQIALNSNINEVAALAQEGYAAGLTVEQARQELVAKIGENIKIRRMILVTTNGVIGTYSHGGRIGVLTSLSTENETLAKDLAMHIAASKPLVVNRNQVPADVIAHEREIFSAQAEKTGKPAEIIKKMIEGRITKFLDEVSVEGQAFVKDPNLTVGQLLEKNQSKLNEFVRFEVGEGIEKKVDNFVEEVMAQVRN